MKTFFLWLGVQCLFARVLVGMVLGLWSSAHIGPDYLAIFLIPATLICIAETIVSGMVVLPLVRPSGSRY